MKYDRCPTCSHKPSAADGPRAIFVCAECERVSCDKCRPYKTCMCGGELKRTKHTVTDAPDPSV